MLKKPVTLGAVALAGLMLSVPAGAAEPQPIYVLFTVDVESLSDGNPDRDIWGRAVGRDEDHGIVRMMEILDEHGAKGTFFVNVYEAEKHGLDNWSHICRTINERRHDVELHTHPGPMFGVKYLHEADLQTQTKILNRGKDLIRQWTGGEVVAHRAGAYAANTDTISASKAAGIDLDFSLNASWPTSDLGKSGLTTNAPIVRDGILCVPVTNYVQASAGSWRSLRFLDIEASSSAEILEVISRLRRHGVRTAVIMMHSFSFRTSGGRGGMRAERELDTLLERLSKDPGVKLVSARQLHEIWRKDPAALAGKDFLPRTGWWMTYCRSWSFFGEGWKNTAVALAPPVAAVIVIAAVTLLWRRRRRRRSSVAPAGCEGTEQCAQ